MSVPRKGHPLRRIDALLLSRTRRGARRRSSVWQATWRGGQRAQHPAARRSCRDEKATQLDGNARLEATKPDKDDSNYQSVGSKGRNGECCFHAATLTALARLGGRGRGAPNKSGRNLSRGMPVAASTASTRSDGMRPVWHQFHTFCFVHPHAFPSFSREPAARTACLTMFSLMMTLNHKRPTTSRLH